MGNHNSNYLKVLILGHKTPGKELFTGMLNPKENVMKTETVCFS